ncbi:hypothetical protein IWQ62_002014 [Dispira parvispora]|uniref:GAF domain-containing protein n=1 Tax=Dispira parvispora TaxID=1520584 RepID=A0A9W8ARA2_9FUNG|nr:hypothetical protein IWQ62_002014 [Dispira parvispora]
MPLVFPGLLEEQPKAEFYVDVLDQAAAVLKDQRNWCTNLANVAALLYHSFQESPDPKHQKVNWVGFYLLNDRQTPDTLWLGPFQGKIACTSIKVGQGVCGTAVATLTPQVVDDVHECSHYITCDPNSRSEIALPLTPEVGKPLVGVLAVDCTEATGFDETDNIALDALVELVCEACDWNF